MVAVHRITYAEAMDILTHAHQNKHFQFIPMVSGFEYRQNYYLIHSCTRTQMRLEKKKKKVGPGSHTRNGVRTHVCIRTLDLKSNALTTRPPWYMTEDYAQIV